jgi:hypothetical protein
MCTSSRLGAPLNLEGEGGFQVWERGAASNREFLLCLLAGNMVWAAGLGAAGVAQQLLMVQAGGPSAAGEVVMSAEQWADRSRHRACIGECIPGLLYVIFGAHCGGFVHSCLNF